jgi:hypothetical protein
MDEVACGFSYQDRQTLRDQPDLSPSARDALEKGGELWESAQGTFYEVTSSEQDASELLAKCRALGLTTAAENLRIQLNGLKSRKRQQR